MAFAREFAPSRARFPASTRCAQTSFRPPRSYHLFTGRHRKPCGQNVLGGVDVTVMQYAAFRACPNTDSKRKRVKDMTTIETAFGRRIELVNLDQGTSIPSGFIFQLEDELTPSYIADRF